MQLNINKRKSAILYSFRYNCNINALFDVLLSLIIPFILTICRSSHLFKIIHLFDKVIRFYPIFDFINQNNQYEQTKNTTGESKRTLQS